MKAGSVELIYVDPPFWFLNEHQKVRTI